MAVLCRLFKCLFFCMFFSTLFRQTESSQKDDDKIKNLPGVTFRLDFDQYSGFLPIDATRSLHYWLVESQNNPGTDPLILWLNGGPGASSLDGLLNENGPFHVNPDQQTLYENVFAWNKFANVLYLESPVGVGFSYSKKDNASLATNDDKTAEENYRALVAFLVLFPEYIKRDFYIAGESYAGVYIPTLAKLVINGMKEGPAPRGFWANLKGIAIGNGFLSVSKNTNSLMDILYFRGLIGDVYFGELKKACCPHNSITKCDFYQRMKMDNMSRCANMSFHALTVAVEQSINDQYNMYQDCYSPRVKRIKHAFQKAFPDLADPYNTAAMINTDSTDPLVGFPCWGTNAMEHYLNIPAVRRALNIPPSLDKRVWKFISDDVNKAYHSLYDEMDSFIEFILKNSKDVRILIYNGDVDLVCNFMGDEWFITNLTNTLAIKQIDNRKKWTFRNQTAGFVKRYDRIDLLTVKGAGHFVPMDRAGPALQMMANFVWKKDYSMQTGINVDPKPLVSPTTTTKQTQTTPSKHTTTSTTFTTTNSPKPTTNTTKTTKHTNTTFTTTSTNSPKPTTNTSTTKTTKQANTTFKTTTAHSPKPSTNTTKATKLTTITSTATTTPHSSTATKKTTKYTGTASTKHLSTTIIGTSIATKHTKYTKPRPTTKHSRKTTPKPLHTTTKKSCAYHASNPALFLLCILSAAVQFSDGEV